MRSPPANIVDVDDWQILRTRQLIDGHPQITSIHEFANTPVYCMQRHEAFVVHYIYQSLY